MLCANCEKDIPRGKRRRVPQAPKSARFCFDCWKNWLAGFWKLGDLFIFAKGGWQMPNTNAHGRETAGKDA